MAASNINVVCITGNLTKDPELRSTPSGTSVCKLRVARATRRRKDGQSGEWVDKPNYFDVTVWGAQGENCRPLPLQGPPASPSTDASTGASGESSGRLQAPGGRDHRRQRPVPGAARSDNAGGGGGGGNGTFQPSSDVPADTSDFEGASVGSGGGSDDDIPF